MVNKTPTGAVMPRLKLQKNMMWLDRLSEDSKGQWNKSVEISSGYGEHDWWVYKGPRVVQCPTTPLGPDQFRYATADAFYSKAYSFYHAVPSQHEVAAAFLQKIFHSGTPKKVASNSSSIDDNKVMAPFNSSSNTHDNGTLSSCKIPLPSERILPPALCNKPRLRILLLSFFTTGVKGRLWKDQAANDITLGLKNRMCYAASRDYRYVIEVVDNSNVKGVAIMFYKIYLVSFYLQFTDWLVWMDYDLIVKNPHNW